MIGKSYSIPCVHNNSHFTILYIVYSHFTLFLPLGEINNYGI